MSNELGIAKTIIPLEVFTAEKGLDPILSKIRVEIDAFVPDITTAKGRKDIASMAHKVAKSKTHLDKVGKELVDELKKKPKMIDTERRRVKDILDTWRDEVRSPLTDWENIEKERVAKHESTISDIKRLATDVGYLYTLKETKVFLDYLNNITIDETLEEFQEQAQLHFNSSKLLIMEKIKELELKEKEDQERELIEKKRREQEQADREERIRKDAEEKAKREERERAYQVERDADLREAKLERDKAQAVLDKEKAEERARVAAENAEKAKLKAEQDKKDAEKRAKDSAERAEKDKQQAVEQARLNTERAAAEKKEKEDREKIARERNIEHRKAINNSILSVLVSEGIERETAISVIKIIAVGKVQEITINY